MASLFCCYQQQSKLSLKKLTNNKMPVKMCFFAVF